MSCFVGRSAKESLSRTINDDSSTSSALEMNDVPRNEVVAPPTSHHKVSIQTPTPKRARNGIGKLGRTRRVKKQRMKRVLSTKNMPKKPRLVGKHGGLKIAAAHVPKKHGMYFSDLFTTMIDSKWRWITLLYGIMYCGSWLFFGLLWYLITFYRGDNYCVDNVYTGSFASAFLFSLETQTTIGYGGRQVTPNCPEAIILLNIQSLVGFLIGALELGLIFAKLSRPRNRAETILFSRNAVVALRDGKMCLMFRVGDVRKSQILEPNVRVQIFRKRITREGIELPFYQQDLSIGIDWSNEEEEKQCYNLFLILPLTIVHVIDENSPLFDIHPRKLADCDFEMVAILEGTVEATGMQTQAKTSYLGDEILWGHEFVNTISESQWKAGRYRVDFSVFDDTFKVNTPHMSAKEYYEGKGHRLAHAFSVESEQEDFEQNFDGGNVTEDSEEEEDNLKLLTRKEHIAIDINSTDDPELSVCYV